MIELIALIGFTAAATPCKSEFDYNTDGVMDGRTLYSYDAQHRLSWEHFTSLGHGSAPSDTQYRYDAQNHLIETTLFVNGKPSQRRTHKYEDGKLTVEEVISVVPECLLGPQKEREFKTFDIPQGPGKPMRMEEEVFEYDLCNAGDGWVTERTTHLYKPGSALADSLDIEDFSAHQPIRVRQVEMKYDEQGRLTFELFVSATYRKGYAQTRYSYDPAKFTRTVEWDGQLDGKYENRTVFVTTPSGEPLSESRYEDGKLKWAEKDVYDPTGRKIREEVDGSGQNPADGKTDHLTRFFYECPEIPVALDSRIGPPQHPSRPGWVTEIPLIYVHADKYVLSTKGKSRDVALPEIESVLLKLPIEAWPLGRQAGVGGPGLATETQHQQMSKNEVVLLELLKKLDIEPLMLPR